MSILQHTGRKKKIIKAIVYSIPVIIFILDCFYWYYLEESVKQMTFRVEGIHHAMENIPIETIKEVDKMSWDLNRAKKKKYIIDELTKVRPKSLYSMSNTFINCLFENELPPEWLRLKSETLSKEGMIYKLRAGFNIRRESFNEMSLMACIERDPFISNQETIDVVYSSDGRELEIRATLYQD